MINEGRPYLGPDTTYSQQRLSRLQDAIDDYLLDDQVSSRQIYEEILSCVDDTLSYYEKNAASRLLRVGWLLVGWLVVGWLVGWLVCPVWLAGWLAGYFGCLVIPFPSHLFSR